MITAKPTHVDAYIAGFPEDVQTILEQIRATVKEAAPEATETIKYAIPAYTLKGNLVYFAAFKNHIGFYAAPTGNEAFKKDLSAYKTGKGSIQFPLDKPIPLTLIAKIVKFRVKENLEKAEKKSR
jgi:uncharacterized protein YdhG (YjbR/CyaY superfamily)